MEVILREDFLQLGYIGDRVKVKRGYARNYLIPRGLAVEASKRNNSLLQHQLSGILAKRLKKKAEAEAFGKTISDVIVEFTIKIGLSGKSFGSVTTRDIEGKLKELGYAVDRKQIKLLDTIKGAGAYRADVKLHSEVTVPIQVKVVAERPVAAEAAEGKSEKRSGKGRRKKGDAAEVAEQEAASPKEEASQE